MAKWEKTAEENRSRRTRNDGNIIQHTKHERQPVSDGPSEKDNTNRGNHRNIKLEAWTYKRYNTKTV